MAPDMGVNGNEAYPFKIKCDQDLKPVTCVMFNCMPMAVYDMVDQRFFQLLREIHIYDAASDGRPTQVRNWTLQPGDTFRSEIAHFVDCLDTGADPLTAGRDQRRPLLAVLAAYASMQCGKRIHLDSFDRT